MAGLLGEVWNDPQSSAMMALAGGLLQGNFGAGVVGASNAYQGMQDSLLKRKLMQQDIQQHDISLQQAQQQWDIMQPALKAWAAQSQSQGQPPVASQPAIEPSQGGGLGSGSYGIPTGGQSAVAPSASAPSGDPFSLNNVVTGSMISRFGGPAAGSAYWERSKLPDSVKTNQFYGIDPASVTASMNRENAAKGNMLVRNGSTLGRTNADGSFTPFFTAPDTNHNANITWQNGSPQAAQIPGLTAGIQGASRAQAQGKASFEPPIQIPRADGTTMTLTRPELDSWNSTGQLPARYSPQGAANLGASSQITNPGNLRPSGASTGFQNFSSPEEGLAALDKNLQNYGGQGVNTVSTIINKWAPPSENNTAAYISDVSKRLGVSPTQQLDMTSPIVRQQLSSAITAPPGFAESQAALATAGAKRFNATIDQGAESPMRVNVLDNIINLSKAGTLTGPNQEFSNKIKGVIADTPGLNKVFPSGWQGSVANYQEIKKFMGQNAIRAWQAAGGTGTDTQLEANTEANINKGLFPQALQGIAEWNKAGELALQGKTNAMQNWKDQNGGNVANQDQFERTWRNNFDPVLFQLKVMDPQKQADYVANLKKTDIGSYGKLMMKAGVLKSIGGF
jgi:hypothetical protein